MRRLLLPLGLFAGALAFGLAAYLPGTVASASPTPHDAMTASANSGQLSRGQTLFDETCSSCHGIDAGGSKIAPNLRGLGAGTVDLWVSSGWMPLATPGAEPARKPALFDRSDTVAIAEYVASLTPGKGVPIPSPDLTGADVAQGFSLFTLNCAPCHTITGAGDALSNDYSAPALHGLTPTQIQEAVETGPGTMPRIIPGGLTKAQLKDVVAFVAKDIEKPTSPGGVGLGGVGPVAEGFIGLFIGVGVCLLIAMWSGDRTEDEEEEGHSSHGSSPTEGVHA